MINKQKGTHDFYGDEARIREYVSKVFSDICERYNYSYIETPIFESSELFHRGIGETSDIVTKETYDFKDKGGRNITLRPEGTAGVVRSYIENKMHGDPNQPKKFYYNGPMFRYERPQSGRDRQFTQFGVELIGTNDPLSDAEVISLLVNTFRLLGLKKVKANINSLGDMESRDNYKKALLDYFKPHLDDLCEDCKKRYELNPLRIIDCKVDRDKEYFKNIPSILDYLNEESKSRFEEVKKYLTAMNVDYEVNKDIVRGLDYYNHTVFEVVCDIPSFGAQNVLGGGGRYNNLVKDLGGVDTFGIGFACGLGRVVMALEKEGVKLPINDSLDIYMMYVSESEKIFASRLSNALRMCGFSVEVELNKRSLKAQFNQADRYNTKCLIILNDSDLEQRVVTVKNNVTKEEEKIDLDYLVYYLDEQLSSLEEDSCECGCDCCDHDCDCGDECDCGDDCTCHDDDRCVHECNCNKE